MRERHDDTIARPDEARELVLRFGEAPSCDRGPLCFELERLATRERIELGYALETDWREALLLPHGAHVVRLPHEVGRPADRCHEIGGEHGNRCGVVVFPGVSNRLGIEALATPLDRRIDHRVPDRMEGALRER